MLALPALSARADNFVEPEPPAACAAAFAKQFQTAKPIVEPVATLADAHVDTDPTTVQVFLVNDKAVTGPRVSDDGDAIYLSSDGAMTALGDDFKLGETYRQALDRRVAAGNARCPVPATPTLVPAALARKAFEKMLRVVAATMAKVSERWNADDVRPLYAPVIDSTQVMDGPLANHADRLGKVVSCDDGALESQSEPIPNATKFSGICRFEHGRANVVILFGFPKRGPSFWLFYFGVSPLP